MKKKERLILSLSIVCIVIGIIFINYNSSQMVKENSRISIYNDENPKIVFKMKNKKMVFDTNFIYNLKNGMQAIYNNIYKKQK